MIRDHIVPQLRQMLTNLTGILEKGAAHADDSSELLERRLAPDMFPFVRQIQTVTDGAKFTVARLSGNEAPSWPDDETTVDQLKARLQTAIEYLDAAADFDFDGWETRQVTLAFMPGMYVSGLDYLHQFALPNFYFHVTTAYALLRSAGVELGKRDYIGHMNFLPLPE